MRWYLVCKISSCLGFLVVILCVFSLTPVMFASFISLPIIDCLHVWLIDCFFCIPRSIYLLLSWFLSSTLKFCVFLPFFQSVFVVLSLIPSSLLSFFGFLPYSVLFFFFKALSFFPSFYLFFFSLSLPIYFFLPYSHSFSFLLSILLSPIFRFVCLCYFSSTFSLLFFLLFSFSDFYPFLYLCFYWRKCNNIHTRTISQYMYIYMYLVYSTIQGIDTLNTNLLICTSIVKIYKYHFLSNSQSQCLTAYFLGFVLVSFPNVSFCKVIDGGLKEIQHLL